MIVMPVFLQGRGGPAHPNSPKGDPDKPRGGGGGGKDGGRQKPGHHKPTAPKPVARKPAHRKPADRKPADHKPAAHKKTAGRGEMEATFEEVEFKPLATGGHLQ